MDQSQLHVTGGKDGLINIDDIDQIFQEIYFFTREVGDYAGYLV